MSRFSKLLKCGVVAALVFAETAAGHAAEGEGTRNLLRNGSFEFANRYNGMKTLLNQGDFLAFMWSFQKNGWCDLGLEQWWGEGPTNAACFAAVQDAHSGRTALAVRAPGVASTHLAYVERPVAEAAVVLTLSWWVKGAGAGKANVELALFEGAAGLSNEPKLVEEHGPVEVRDGTWVRGTLTMRIPEAARAVKQPAFRVRFAVATGSCVFDDVQLEWGERPTAFAESPTHALSLEVDGLDPKELPKFRRGQPAVRRLLVRNTFGAPLAGTLRLYLDSWDRAGRTCVAEVPCADWKPDEVRTFAFEPGKMEPNAYVFIAGLDPVARTNGVFSSTNTGWGVVGASQLLKRNGFRFAVFGETEPRKLFGVGNGMVENDAWWGGATMANAVHAKSIHPVLLGEADPYKGALIGAPGIRESGLNAAGPKDLAEACNPVALGQIHAYSPNGRKVLKERALALGRTLAEDPSVAAVKLDNEGTFVNRGEFCPDKWADLDFRSWVRTRHGEDLKALNAVWGTAFASWDEVVQPISGMKNGTRTKTGGEAIDWTASLGKMTKAAEARLRECPAMALDWFRWRAASVIRLYADFVAHAKTVDTRTLYGNNYCWPNFYTHIIWPQWRTQDVVMLDLQYVCGFPRTLGTNEEMIDILEQAESVARGRIPIWGREVYYQPHYPGEMAALQNWALIAHGLSVPMTFAWRPYADYNREIFRDGPKAWLRKDAPPMWFLLDTDGSEVPGYAPNARAAEEIAAFHRAYDGFSLKRIPGDVALYLSTDTSAYVMYETFDKPFESELIRARVAVAAGLRMNGVRIEYFDDATLDEVTPDRFPVLVAPAERVLSAAAEKRLRRYAEQGGRLIAFNAFNAVDDNLRPKECPGTSGWKGAISRVEGFRGKYDSHPYNTAEYEATWMKILADHPFIPRRAWWENERPREEGEENRLAGEGRPLVEVVVRKQEGSGRRFVFVLNKGGAGRGRLRGTDFEGVSELVDALTGKRESCAFEIPAFGYRVFVLEPRRVNMTMWPDVLGVTIPPNVAPLNFAVVGTGRCAASLRADDGATLAADVDEKGIARWNPAKWKDFLTRQAGRQARLEVVCGDESLSDVIRISEKPMDACLTYRLIPPSYTFYGWMGIWERDLTSFAERPLFRNQQTEKGQCVNCHTFNRANPDEFLFHTRKVQAGTHIVSRKWGARKVDLRVEGAFGTGVYPAWHPSGDFIAFSENETQQHFYADGADKIEVADLQSDLMLYSLRDDTVTFIEEEHEIFETFPTWSPDGRSLYSVRARTDLKEMPDEQQKRSSQFYRQAHKVFYDLVVRQFDPATRTFSPPRMLIDAKASGRSITFPRVSPDGRWLVMTIGPYGSFHVWHRDSDLWILDLRLNELRPLTELNSEEAESYHAFSSDGTWMVFSSRRIDGGYTRPFFAHFDARQGTFSKPFLLPTENPNDHVQRLCSYNVPEFATGPVKVSAAALRRLVERNPQRARRAEAPPTARVPRER